LHYISKNYKINLYFLLIYINLLFCCTQKEDRFLSTQLKIDKEDKDMRRLTNRSTKHYKNLLLK